MLEALLLGSQKSFDQLHTLSAKWLSIVSEELFVIDRAGMMTKVQQVKI